MASTLCAQERGDMFVSIAFRGARPVRNHCSPLRNNERLPKLEFAPVPLFRDQQALLRVWESATRSKRPERRTGSDDEQLFDKKDCSISNRWPATTFHWAEFPLCTPLLHRLWLLAKQIELTSKEVSEEDASRFRVGISASTSNSDRPTAIIGIMFNAGDLGYQTTVIKQDGDNKVSNRDFARPKRRCDDRIHHF